MAEKKHDFTRTEIVAGLMVIFSVLVLVGFIAMLQGWQPPQEVHTYHARFRGTNGLGTNAAVYWGGLKCGKVESIAPDPEKQSLIRVTFSVDPIIPVNEMSVASIEQVSLTAERHLEISTGADDAPRIASGGEVKGISKGYGFIELPDLNGVIARVENTLDSGNKLVDDLIEMLGVDEAKKKEQAGKADFVRITRVLRTVNGTLSDARGMVGDLRSTIEEQRPNLTAILTKVQGIEDSAQTMVDELNAALAENRPLINSTLRNVDGLVGKVGSVVDGVAADLDGLVQTLQQTLDNARDLSGTANDFLQANRPDIEDIIQSLRDTVRNLQDFSRVLAEQPSAIVRGAKPVGR